MSAALAAAGYSGTPLAHKLGYRDGQRALFLDLPETLAELAGVRNFAAAERRGWDGLADARDFDVVHGFTASRATLADAALLLPAAIRRDGMVWICWPKRAARVPTDVTDETILALLLPTGLVDVKVAAIDEIWSGLKLVMRRELR